MKKGFTIKELIIAIFILGFISYIAIHIFSNSSNNSNQTELLDQAKLYIKSLNTYIITVENQNEDILFQTYLPKNVGETVTFNIENIRINQTDKYKGNIKVTYIDKNKYEYKIAIHDNTYMIGTQNKLINEGELNIKLITNYDKKIFYN